MCAGPAQVEAGEAIAWGMVGLRTEDAVQELAQGIHSGALAAAGVSRPSHPEASATFLAASARRNIKSTHKYTSWNHNVGLRELQREQDYGRWQQ